MPILLYGRTIWTLTECKEKKLDNNCTRMLGAILSKSWKQHTTKQLLYNHLPLITKTIHIKRRRHAGNCWRSKDDLITDVLLWTPLQRRTDVGGPARTYLQQLCMDIGCCLEDLLNAIETNGEKESGKSVLAARHDDDDVKTKIDKTQQNKKYRLRGDRDETRIC